MSSSAEERAAPPPRRAGWRIPGTRLGRLASGVLLLSLVGALVTLLTSLASAPAATYSQKSLLLVVDKTSVTATLLLAASVQTKVELFGVCVRGAQGVALDYPYETDVTITTAGTRWTGSKAFAPGSYTFFACVRHGSSWWTGAAERTVTITDQPATGPSPGSSSPKSSSAGTDAMPVGDLPGWKQNYREDFTKPARLGEIEEVYGSGMRGYDGFPDTSKRGIYTPDRVLSVSGGVLDFYLHTATVEGVSAPRVAAPILNRWKGQTYGRYSLRFRADDVAGYKVAFMLWPSSDRWEEGEMNFPEGRLSTTISAYSHCVGNPADNCLAAFTGVDMRDWHVATTEWTPAGVTFFLDGRRLGTATGEGVPSTKFRWTLQAETEIGGDGTPPSAAGHLQVDWATSYRYLGT